MPTAIPLCAAAASLHRSADVVEVWRSAGAARWFAKDAGFGRLLRERGIGAQAFLAAGGFAG